MERLLRKFLAVAVLFAAGNQAQAQSAPTNALVALQACLVEKASEYSALSQEVSPIAITALNDCETEMKWFVSVQSARYREMGLSADASTLRAEDLAMSAVTTLMVSIASRTTQP